MFALANRRVVRDTILHPCTHCLAHSRTHRWARDGDAMRRTAGGARSQTEIFEVRELSHRAGARRAPKYLKGAEMFHRVILGVLGVRETRMDPGGTRVKYWRQRARWRGARRPPLSSI